MAVISGNQTSRIFLIEPGGGLDLRNAVLLAGNGASSNTGDGSGGAIYADQASSLFLDRVAVRNNQALFAGAVYLGPFTTTHIKNSSFTTNKAENATAIFLFDGGTLLMSNSTMSGNILSAVNPNLLGCGALCVRGSSVTIRNSTIAYNLAKTGAGITLMVPNSFNTTLDIGNSIVAENSATGLGADIRQFNSTEVILTSAGGNLIHDTDTVPPAVFTQPNDLQGVNPLLAPVNANNGTLEGYPIVYHRLQAGSPARNGGLNANAIDPISNAPLTTDIRGAGFARILATTVDIGAYEDATGNTSLIVSKNANSNDLVCDVDCSLREAVLQASFNFGTDTITFAPNVFGIVPLGGTEIVIQNQNVNIIGPQLLNSGVVIISGENTNRIFRLNNATVNISGLTLANGNHTGGDGLAGGILAENNSNLTLDRTIVRDNTAVVYGAMYLTGGGTHHMTNSTISGNSAVARIGIGLGTGTLNMANCTVTGNFDTNGINGAGAVYLGTGDANIRNSTIAFNRTAGGGGGITVVVGTLNIGNSIVANNVADFSPDIDSPPGFASVVSAGGNLVRDISGFPAGTFSQTNDVTGIDPALAPLADNGGSVTTHLLMPNSPAINLGINANAIDPFDNSALAFDARGNVARILFGTVDKGALESLAPTAATVNVSGRVTTADGHGIKNALVVLTDLHGATRSAVTSSFGYFNIADVEPGQTYVIQVMSKRYTFTATVLNVTDDVSDLTLMPESNETKGR